MPGKKLVFFTPNHAATGIFRWLARTAANYRCAAYTSWLTLTIKQFDPVFGAGVGKGRPTGSQRAGAIFATMRVAYMDCWKQTPSKQK